MPEDGAQTVADRVAALIEECRCEREASAALRARVLASGLFSETSPAAVVAQLTKEANGEEPLGIG